MTIPITVPHPTATRRTVGAPRAAAGGAAIQSRDQALFTSVATLNANMLSGAMVGLLAITAVTTATIRTGAIDPPTAVTTAIIRTRAIDPGRGPTRGAMAVSGAGERHIATDTNRPPIDMRSRRGRQRRFGAGAATKTDLDVPR